MITKVTFEPLKGRRYRVRKNGAFVIRDGKPLIVNEASIAGTRRALMNEGRTPPPPLPEFVKPGRYAYASYSTTWNETRYLCSWCFTNDLKQGRFTGSTKCFWCSKPLTVVLSEPAPTDNIEKAERAEWNDELSGRFDWL